MSTCNVLDPYTDISNLRDSTYLKNNCILHQTYIGPTPGLIQGSRDERAGGGGQSKVPVPSLIELSYCGLLVSESARDGGGNQEGNGRKPRYECA